MENNRAENISVQEEKEEKKKKRWLLLLLLLLLLLIASCATTFALLNKGKKAPVLDDAPIPPKIEAGAEPIDGDNTDDKLSAPEGGGAVSLTYSKEVDIDLTAKKASLVFGNPSKSNQDVALKLIIQDTVILQSGSLPPGNRVTSLNLADGADKKLTAGVYDGKFAVYFYDSANGTQAKLNAEIPVTVTVSK